MRFLKQNLFLLLLLLGSNTYAATLYVKHDATGTNNGTSWTNAYTDLQVAMNAAAVNDEIWVAAGTYRPNQKPTGVTAADNRLKTFYLKKNIKLYGGFVGTETALSQRDAVLNLTILSGDVGTVGVVTDNSYHVFITKDLTAAAVIDGFTIKDGSSQNYTTSSMTYSFHTYNSHYGAGFYNAGSSPTLTNIIVSNNWASYNGGGFYNFSSSPTISNSTINNNTATHGGGIYNNTLSSPVLNNVTISSNTASSLGGGVNNTSSSAAPTFTNVTVINNTAANGGGFYNFSSSPTFNNVIVNNNSASSTGGGFYNYSCSSIINNVTVNNNTAHIGGGIYNSTASPILTNVTINNNSTSSHGGAFANFSSSTPTLTNVTVNNNISSGYGAAFYNSQSSPTLTNVLINNNTSSSYGGGFHNYSSSPILTNITMTNNSAPFGGGFYNGSTSSPVIKNSIIWNNGSSEVLNSSSTPTFYYSIIKGSGGSSAWLSSFGIDGGNNLATDPLFVSSTDFSLQNSSPAINAGNNTYNTTVTDLAGSTRIQGTNIDMGAYEVIFMTATATPVSCYGGANGTITLTLSNAGNYTFLWNDGDTAQNRTNLIAGTYIVTVTGNSGIVGNYTIIVNQPLVDLTVSAIAPNVSCNGNNDGFINLVVNGGTSPYNYLWNDGSTLQNRTNLIAGTYTVTVTDANGCIKTVSANIVQPAILAATTTATNVSCYGSNNGSINLAVTGGTTPYSYLWNNGRTTKNRTNLTQGTYTVTVTDANGCTIIVNDSITQPAILAATTTATNVSCNGGNNGSINLAVTGGTLPYTYLWRDNYYNYYSTSQNITNLTVGTYTVTVTDANGCTKTVSATITQPAILNVTKTVTNVFCNGGNNGSINLTVTGGSSPYTYLWNNGSTSQNITNLTAGIYKVTVTDANGCTKTVSTTITQPAILSATTTATNLSCNGVNNGSINLAVTGGTTPYTYLWNNGSTTKNRTNLTPGTYTVTVTDAKGCTIIMSDSIIQAVILAATATATNVSCYGGNNGSINLAVTGGTLPYTYLWRDNYYNYYSTSQNIITDLTAGTYIITVTDANGCTKTVSATITQPAILNVTKTVTNVSCNGGNNGSINLTVTGGSSPYTYLWNNGSTSQNRTNLTTGIYKVTVTDANGCTKTVSTTITQPAILSATTTATNLSCNGVNNGSINLAVTGGTTPYTYLWNNGSTLQNRTNLTAGTYTVTITDAKGCTIIVSDSITQPAILAATTTATNVSCYGGNNGSINLVVTGGTAPYNYYSWADYFNNSQNITNLTAGTYTVTVTDDNGCTIIVNDTITQPAILTATATVTNVFCNGGNNGSINLTVTGGTSPYTYLWNNGSTSQNRTNLTAGSYRVTVTDSKGCTETKLIKILQPTVLTITPTVTNVSCNSGTNGSISLAVIRGTAPYTYLWNDGSTLQNRTNLIAGTYTVTVTDANGCVKTVSATITQPAILNVTKTVTNVFCNGGNNGSINLTVTGGTSPYTYLWNNGSTTKNRTNLTAGTYTLTVTDAKGCTIIVSDTITQPAILEATETVTNVSCYGANNGSIDLVVTGGTEPYTYLWNDGNTLKNRTNLTAGIYTVTVTDANGCQKTDTAQIAAADTMIVTIDTTHVLCNSYATGAIHLNIVGTATAYTFAWSDDSTTSATRTNLLAGIYNVTVTNSSGCQKTFNIPVTQPQYGLTAAIFVFNRPCNGNNNGELYGSVIPYGMFSTGTPPYQYLWSTGDTTQIISNLATGNYGLTVTDANGCTYSLSTNLLNCQGMALISNTTEKDVQESNEITIQQKDDVSATVLVYPNPANDLFHIVLNSFENEIAHIGIFSSLGILVYSKTTTEPTTVIPTNDWTNGIYHIQIRTGEKMETRTVLINH